MLSGHPDIVEHHGSYKYEYMEMGLPRKSGNFLAGKAHSPKKLRHAVHNLYSMPAVCKLHAYGKSNFPGSLVPRAFKDSYT